MTIIYDSSDAYWDEMYNHTKHVFLSGDATSAIDFYFNT